MKPFYVLKRLISVTSFKGGGLMRYFGVIVLLLLVMGIGGYYYNNSSASYTIQIKNISDDVVVILNGTVVDRGGFSPREGVNRLTIIKDNTPIWVGQWVFEEGSLDKFIEELRLDSRVTVNSKGNKYLGIEIAMHESQG